MTGPADCGLADLVGSFEAELEDRLGEAAARRVDADSVWLVFDLPAGRLRVRCRRAGPGDVRVASWTLRFGRGHARLAAAARLVGLWPAAAPDVAAADVETPLVRRPLPAPAGAALYSLTATVRAGRFTHLSVFDEPPDWL